MAMKDNYVGDPLNYLCSFGRASIRRIICRPASFFFFFYYSLHLGLHIPHCVLRYWRSTDDRLGENSVERYTTSTKPFGGKGTRKKGKGLHAPYSLDEV